MFLDGVVDVRIVRATSRDPRKVMAAGRFREAPYRLHVIPNHPPPLGERGDERMISDYTWPGSVRKQQSGDGLTAGMLKPAPGDIDPLAAVERPAIEAAIAPCGGNVPRAIALLEIASPTPYRKRQSRAEKGS